MPFQEFTAYLDDALRLPIRLPSGESKTYVILGPDAEFALHLQAIGRLGLKVATGGTVSDDEKASLALSDEDERTLYERILGDAGEQMLADKVPFTTWNHAGQCALTWTIWGVDAAEIYWNGLGKAPAKKPQDRKPKSARPASGGTRSPKAPAKRSAGPTSSSGGGS